MAARLSDRVTYAYCGECSGLLLNGRRQAELSGRPHIRHAWCAVVETFTARWGQQDWRN